MAITKSPLEAFGRKARERTPVRQLFDACFSGDIDAARDLVQVHGPELLRKTDGAGDLPIQAAAGEGHLEMVQFLVDAGMPFDKKGKSCTPLYEAAYGGQLAVVEYLLDKGADINFVCLKGSALMGALYPAYADDVAVYLIERGASVGREIKDEDGNGVLYWVMEKDNAAAFVAMARKGHLPGRAQDTPLDRAVYLAHLGMPISGKIANIVSACLSDPALSGDPSEERLHDLAGMTQDSDVRSMLYAEATAAALRAAIPEDENGVQPAVRRALPSL